MPKNRKRSEPGVKLGPVFKAFVACLCIGLAGVGYVWQKNQLLALGEQMKKKENRSAELELENFGRRDRLHTLRSVDYLEERIKYLRLGLAAPHPGQVVTLQAPSLPGQGEDVDVQMVKLERRSND